MSYALMNSFMEPSQNRATSGYYRLGTDDVNNLSVQLNTLDDPVPASTFEYDQRVPDSLLVASPGGVATTYHHHTKGFYGNGDGNSSDIFGSSTPRYISGEYGNLYRQGESAPVQLGMYPSGDRAQYWKDQYPQIKNEYLEKFTHDRQRRRQIQVADPDIVILDDGTQEESDDIDMSENSKSNASLSMLTRLFLILIAYVVLSLWTMLAFQYLKENVHNGEDMSTYHLLCYCCICTLMFFIVFWWLGYPKLSEC